MADQEGMINGEITHIPDRLVADPVVFRGMTDQEVIFITTIASIVWIPISILILSFFGVGIFGLAVGLGLAMLTLVLAGKRLVQIKIKQPDGLHIVHFKKKIQQKGFAKFGFIDESKIWDIRRHNTVSRVTIEKEEY